MLTIGCHLSKRRGYLEMAKEAASINANTFQYFTRSPRGSEQAALDEKDAPPILPSRRSMASTTRWPTPPTMPTRPRTR